jgi:hypothetical protein
MISHLYYTKSLKRDGEGVFACSETLDKEEKREIEKTVIVGYEAPANMLAPTEEDIAQFPQNYAYYKLKTCRKQALLLSTYTGRCNHTPSRFGNFLTHIILFDESITNTNLPALMYDLPFRTHLTVEEEQNFTIDSSALSIDFNKSKNIIFLKSISFLNADNNRKLVFKEITDKIVNGWLKDEKHRIVIKATKDEAKDFIFALYSILPSSLINQYSFATYKSTLRDSPFQIVGILSDVKLMDNDSLFDLSKTVENYKSNNEFTELIFETINKKNPVNLEQYFSGYDLAGLNRNQLNTVSKTPRFKVNITNETLPVLKEILLNQPSEQKRDELIYFVIQRNPDLFLEYILEELKEKVKYDSVERKINVLFERFELYFNDNKALSQGFYEKIYLPLFKEEKETGKLAYLLFMKFEIPKTLDNYATEDELRLIDNYFKDNQNLEIDMKLNPFLKKHIGIITEKVPFLYGKKVKKELLESIEKCTINSKEISEKIQFLNEKDSFDIITSYLYSLRKIGTFDLSFADYLSKVESYFDDKKNEFWKYFFSLKDDDFIENDHSLSYLKRQFVIAIIEKEDYQEIVSRLKFTDFEKDWLIDYFRERGELNKITHFKKLKSISVW